VFVITAAGVLQVLFNASKINTLSMVHYASLYFLHFLRDFSVLMYKTAGQTTSNSNS